jgi:hypothetical protein
MRHEYPYDPSVALDATVTDLADDEKLGDKFAVPPPVARMLKRWTITEAAFAQAEDQPAVAEPERPEVIKRNLQRVIEVMAAKKDGKNLRAAAEWHFDSLAEENETASLLYASIGLEAALDSPENSTTARLSDRLAWLLGGTRKERNALTEEYQSFYGVRSGLVHGRERSLGDDGRQQLRWGQVKLRQVIARDLAQWPLASPKKLAKKTNT